MVHAPLALGAWRTLDATGKEAYLDLTRDRWFAHANRAGSDDDEAPPPGGVYVLDGAHFDDLLGFFCAMGEAVNGPGGYFGLSKMSFDDCLFGGFGLTGPCTLRWRNADRSRRLLTRKLFDELVGMITSVGRRHLARPDWVITLEFPP